MGDTGLTRDGGEGVFWVEEGEERRKGGFRDFCEAPFSLHFGMRHMQVQKLLTWTQGSV